ncbi:hypothetical protein FB45DRAFT_1056059 [Roridomyces roridus]|uniref:Uncharacterized protein n=1 Tax=Roridomyces roridus TaxID=1738132 RepID=A0AAD7C1S7_9AGAR|nr:hypothetical protein FB45DRAFT_1056059 [Roridomyces roridus]
MRISWFASKSGVSASLGSVSDTVLEFNHISMTSCNPANISWVWNSAAVDGSTEMSLTITNIDAPQLSAEAASLSRRDDPITLAITSGLIKLAVGEIIWPNVSVPAGTYILQASSTNQNFPITSSLFFVLNGCSISSPGSSSLPSTLSTTSTPSPAPTAPLHSQNMNDGAMAGGIIGGMAIAVAACFVFHRFRTARRLRRSTKWGGRLASDDHLHLPMQEQASPFRDPVRSSYTTMSTLDSTASTFPSSEAPTPSAAFPSGTSLEISNLRGPEPQYNLVDPECIAVHPTLAGSKERI